MHHHWRAASRAGIFAAVTACGGVTIRQNPPTSDHPGIPRITGERLQGCVQDYGNQLPSGSWAFSPTIKVDQDGRVIDVDIGNMPNTAPDLAACTREAFRDMAIPSSVFNMRATESASTDEPTKEQHAQLAHPAVVVVIVVVEVGEIILEAGAITILFATTVKVIDKAADDVMDLAKRWRPRPNKNRCLDAAAGGTYMWRAFCDSLGKDVDRQDCWSRDLQSEENKRGWCSWRFR